MDQRIVEKISKLEQNKAAAKIAEQQQKVEAEEANKKYIISKLPAARIWVEERLLDIIAAASAQDNSLYKVGRPSRLNLEYCDDAKNGNRDIPVEAKAQAVSEIDGLTVQTEWVGESDDPNDESHRYKIPAHYSYHVVWK